MPRAINFNAGPATLPLPALERARDELLDFAGSGMSILEHSHRGKLYEAVHAEAIDLTRQLLSIPDDYDVLLLQGGASQQFAVVPMNLLEPGASADYVVTGVWATRAIKEAQIVGRARVAASTEESGGRFTRVPEPSELELDPNAAYLHITSNNTIFGTQWPSFPASAGVPLVCDMSSDIMSRPLNVGAFGLIYAGAQKNLGPSGLTLVIVKKALVERGRRDIPKIFQYRTHAAENSLYHTPPTFAVYLYRNVLDVIRQGGGLAALEQRNRAKADRLYAVLDELSDFYRCPVPAACRSLMNVVFTLPSAELEAQFLAAAAAERMVGLKGHRLVGGVRVSIYNAAPMEWVERLVELMRAFWAEHS
jgi:phosphoserine aminotransferase